MASLIARIHEQVREARITRQGRPNRLQHIQRGKHKEYPRMPRIPLPQPRELSVTLAEALQKRSSFDQALFARPLALESWGTLLGLALGAREQGTRNYPSGGALYPVETYVLGNALEGYGQDAFHYHPTAHALEHLWSLPQSFSMKKLIPASNTPLSNILIVFTAVWERSAKKYGTLAYSHGLIEAGHMAENILLVAAAAGMQSRPVAGCDDPYLQQILDIDTETEQFVHGVLLSAPAPYRHI